jgi:CubicO group peptidase (beta-lactamase class C family)
VVTTGPDVTFALPTDNAELNGSATDDGLPAGSTLTYTWEVVNGPSGPNGSPGVVFANANAPATSARFAGGVGEYTLRLNASDGDLTGSSTLRVTVQANPNLYPDPIQAAGVHGWITATPAEENMDVALLDQARDYSMAQAQNTNEGGYIIRHGRLVYSWGDTTTRFEMKSTTKSMGGLALLLALDEAALSLSDKLSTRLPGIFGVDPAIDTSAVTTGSLDDITLLQLATHTSGLNKPDEQQALIFTPGTTWSYSDQGLNWLADVLTHTYAQDLNTLLFNRIYTTLGIRPADLTWRDNQYRTDTLNVNGTPVKRRELGSGIEANVNAMARVGLLMLRKGVWKDQLLLSNAVVDRVQQPVPEIAGAQIADSVNFPGATTNYGILWWTNKTGQLPDVPTDAFWAWGLHETLIFVVPSLDLIVTRAGVRGWHAQEEFWNADYAVLAPFITPIVQSVSQ